MTPSGENSPYSPGKSPQKSILIESEAKLLSSLEENTQTLSEEHLFSCKVCGLSIPAKRTPLLW
jgi:RNA polymerase-binding transcription factor DksA